MRCRNINELIPKLIRREIDTVQRITIIDHLKKCDTCRIEYLNQLKMFYLLDKGLVSDKSLIDKSDFYEQVGLKRARPQKSDGFHPGRSHIYAAAAILLFIVFSILWFKQDQNDVPINEASAVIEEALLDEDWFTLQRILKNDNTIKSVAKEEIPISLLIDKLNRLKNQGIQSIDFINLLSRESIYQSPVILSQNTQQFHQIEINALVQSLERFRFTKDRISLYEIGLFLYEANKGGTKS